MGGFIGWHWGTMAKTTISGSTVVSRFPGSHGATVSLNIDDGTFADGTIVATGGDDTVHSTTFALSECETLKLKSGITNHSLGGLRGVAYLRISFSDPFGNAQSLSHLRY